MPELSTTTRPKARKQHACDQCGSTIQPGETYARRAEAAEAAVARARALHPNRGGDCFECDDGFGGSVPWPCPTIRALGGAE